MFMLLNHHSLLYSGSCSLSQVLVVLFVTIELLLLAFLPPIILCLISICWRRQVDVYSVDYFVQTRNNIRSGR